MTLQLEASRRARTAEVLKRGCEAAAQELCNLSGQAVRIDIAEVDFLTRAVMVAGLSVECAPRVTGASGSFSGAFSGRAILAFPEADGLVLLRHLLRQDREPDFMTEMDQAALTEIANIVINSCLDDLAKGGIGAIAGNVPSPLTGTLATILNASSAEIADAVALTVQARIAVQDCEVTARLIFLTAAEGLERFWRAAVRDIRFSAPTHG